MMVRTVSSSSWSIAETISIGSSAPLAFSICRLCRGQLDNQGGNGAG